VISRVLIARAPNSYALVTYAVFAELAERFRFVGTRLLAPLISSEPVADPLAGSRGQ
jgi:hypothetical protein